MFCRKVTVGAVAIVGAIACSVSPAFAQTEPVADLEAFVDASSSAEGALTAAEAQANSGDVSMAATTLERALIDDPDNVGVRLAYIGYLCKLDDRQAALFEVGKLAGKKIAAASWAKVETACGRMARPPAKKEG